jgi:hypothetical protein
MKGCYIKECSASRLRSGKGYFILYVSVIVAVSCHGGESYHQLQSLSKNGRRISIGNKAEKRGTY